MNRRISAALVRLAALCGLLVVPSVAVAQLKCENDKDKQIRKVAFEGNVHFRDDELEAHVIATPTDLTRRILKFLGTERCIRPGLLASDALRLRTFYVDEGFPRARVDTATTTEGKWVDVLFRIHEGDPVTVDSVLIIGIDSLGLGDDLPTKLNSRKGGRYSKVLVQADVDTIEARMRNTGHPLGIVLQEADSVDNHAAVTLRVTPGPLARIGTITINSTGIDNRPSVIDSGVIRDILRFSEGDRYSERALFESERQFYRVGNFLSAEITTDTGHVKRDSLIDVHVRVLEDLMRLFSVNPAYGTLDCLRGRVEYADKAFLKGLNRLELSGQVSKVGWASPWPGIRELCRDKLKDDDIASDTINYNATVRLTRPITLRGGLLPSFSAYRERRGGYHAYFRTTLIGGSASLAKNLTRTILGQASYNLEYGHTFAEPPVLCFLFRACDQIARDQLTGDDKRLAIVGLALSRDRRNNPDSTTSGTALRLDLRTSQPLIGSDVSLSFNKAVVDASWYHEAIGSNVLALRVRGGLIGGGVATSGGRLPPPQERLYTGGETSVRGFSQNELGPLIYVTDDDTTKLGGAANASARDDSLRSLRMRVIPAGGNAMYVANIEYRLRGPFLSTLQTILFVDVGKLWTRELSEDGQGVKWTPGVAFRYFSPVGPIQVNLGYNKYPRPEGPVYLDRGIASGPLVCLSGLDNTGQCKRIPAIRQPPILKRITLTVAFPPDF